MNATETAVETIYKAMGYRRCGMDHYVNHQECQRIYDPKLRRNRDGTYEGDCLRWDWPDPLADTPEGWWEFGQILEWAKGWLEDRGLTLELLCQRGVWKGNIYRGKAWSDTKILTDGESDDQRELAVRLLSGAIEALAEAVGGTA